MPTNISIVTPELRMTIDQLAESTRQQVSRYIIPDHEKGHTGSRYKAESGIDMLGKHSALGKSIKALGDIPADDKSSSDESRRRRKKIVAHHHPAATLRQRALAATRKRPVFSL